MTASAYSPAPRSSTTIPVPSGSRSSRRIGNGFQISKTRKSIRPARKVFQASGTAMTATSCPATSSTTTNCGSFKPEERATSVAAGIPMRVTAAAAIMVAQARFATGIWELANAHTKTVANEPHVPGPGLRRPVPKKVATSVAQTGAPGRDAPATAGGTPAPRSLVTGEGVGFTALLHRRGRCRGLLRRRR
jgi:hypothetical protein